MAKKPTLHLLMGLPGAGKSTLARALAEVTDAQLLSSDEMRKSMFIKPCFSQDEHDRLYGIIDHNLEHLLGFGYDVIYDANLNRKHHRQEKYDIAKKYDATVRLWWVTTDRELAKERRINEQDSLLLPKDETSAEMFDRIADILEEPAPEEPTTKIIGQNITPNSIRKLL
ncbi:MAG: AAA family ATPase [Cumulibacter sp.]